MEAPKPCNMLEIRLTIIGRYSVNLLPKYFMTLLISLQNTSMKWITKSSP